MLLIITFSAAILLGLVFIHASYNASYDLDTIGGILVAFGSAFLIISVTWIIISHALADYTIEKNKMEYDGLCKRYEIIKSDYEDMSKSDVINDITEWNTKVYDTKYWTENPWTNWFNPKKVADNLEYISLEESEE